MDKVEQLKERLRKYEANNTPNFEDVRLTVLAHGKKYISIEDLLKVIDEIFESQEE